MTIGFNYMQDISDLSKSSFDEVVGLRVSLVGVSSSENSTGIGASWYRQLFQSFVLSGLKKWEIFSFNIYSCK